MKNKEIANSAVSLICLTIAAPMIVGSIAKSAGRCYMKIAKQVNHIKKNCKKIEISTKRA